MQKTQQLAQGQSYYLSQLDVIEYGAQLEEIFQIEKMILSTSLAEAQLTIYAQEGMNLLDPIIKAYTSLDRIAYWAKKFREKLKADQKAA